MALTDLFRQSRLWPWCQAWLRWLGIALLIGLSACGQASALPPGLVTQALTLQASQTTTILTQQFRHGQMPAPSIHIDRVTILNEQPLPIQGLTGFRVQGTYEATVDLPDRQLKQHHRPFELYIQRQLEGKTWRLAHPITQPDGTLGWGTQQLPLETAITP